MREQMNVVMLATETQHTGTLSLTPKGELSSNVLLGIPYEIYITDNSEIKIGDYVMYVDGGSNDIRMVSNIDTMSNGINFNRIYFSNGGFSQPSLLKKIIATTNPELLYVCPHNKHHVKNKSTGNCEDCGRTRIRTSIAKIPQTFIEAYIHEYNAGKPITKVDVEMEECLKYNEPDYRFEPRRHPASGPEDTTSFETRAKWRAAISGEDIDDVKWKMGNNVTIANSYWDANTGTYVASKSERNIKLRPDGTIITHPIVEQMFTKEDMEAAYNAGMEVIQEFIRNIGKQKGLNLPPAPTSATKWLSEKYPNK